MESATTTITTLWTIGKKKACLPCRPANVGEFYNLTEKKKTGCNADKEGKGTSDVQKAKDEEKIPFRPEERDALYVSGARGRADRKDTLKKRKKRGDDTSLDRTKKRERIVPRQASTAPRWKKGRSDSYRQEYLESQREGGEETLFFPRKREGRKSAPSTPPERALP